MFFCQIRSRLQFRYAFLAKSAILGTGCSDAARTVEVSSHWKVKQFNPQNTHRSPSFLVCSYSVLFTPLQPAPITSISLHSSTKILADLNSEPPIGPSSNLFEECTHTAHATHTTHTTHTMHTVTRAVLSHEENNSCSTAAQMLRFLFIAGRCLVQLLVVGTVVQPRG